MKKVIVIVLFFCAQFIVAQQGGATFPANDNLIYDTKGLETPPQYPGGIQKLQDLLITQLQGNYKGMLVLMFVIEKDGSLSDVKVLRDMGPGSGEKALQVLKTADKWIPGRQNGQLVRVKYAFHITLDAGPTTKSSKK